jgi:predicted O-methyltransferase YrrM
VAEPDPKALDELFTRVLGTEDDALRAAREAGAAAGMPAIEVSAQHGKLLFLLAAAMRATRVLEIGTLAGYSTIQLARAVGPGGQVVTLEFEPKHAEVARENLARAGVGDRVEVIVGAALDTLPTLAGRAETFDLIFIDADKVSYPDYFPWALKLSRPGSLIIADNIVRKGAVADESSDDASVQAVRRYNELLAAESRVSATAIQTVGSKGYDGFALALVTK